MNDHNNSYKLKAKSMYTKLPQFFLEYKCWNLNSVANFIRKFFRNTQFYSYYNRVIQFSHNIIINTPYRFTKGY